MAKITNRVLASIGAIFRTDQQQQGPTSIDFTTPVQPVLDVSRYASLAPPSRYVAAGGVGADSGVFAVDSGLVHAAGNDQYATIEGRNITTLDLSAHDLWVIGWSAYCGSSFGSECHMAVVNGSIPGYATTPWAPRQLVMTATATVPMVFAANFYIPRPTYEMTRPFRLYGSWVAYFHTKTSAAANWYVALLCQVLPKGITPPGMA